MNVILNGCDLYAKLPGDLFVCELMVDESNNLSFAPREIS